jgi:DME family drug/metabolite transporter
MMLGAAVLFGTTGTAQAFGPADANPLSVGAVRQVIGGTVLLGIVAVWWVRTHGWRRPRWSRKVGWVLLGGACVMAFQATFFFGTRGNGVAVGTVIALGSSPLFAGLFDGLRGRRPSRRWLAATSLAVVGILLLSGAIGSAVTLQPGGVLASLVAGAAYAGYAVAAAEVVHQGVAAVASTAAIIGTSGLIGAAVLPFTDNSWLAEPRGLAVALWLGGVTVVVSYLLMGAALQHLAASTAITLGLAEPLTAAVLGVAVLGETLAPLQMGGVLLVLGGVVIAGTGNAVARVPVVA